MSSLLRIGRMLPVATRATRYASPALASMTQRLASSFSPLQQQQQQQLDEVLQYREKPGSLSYFTGNYKYNDLLIEFDALYKRFENWKPTDQVVNVPSDLLDVNSDKVYSWKQRDKMSELLSIPLTTSQWRKITTHLSALASLPKPLPAAVAKMLEPYERFDATQQSSGDNKTRTLDDMGRAYAAGRRKESSARCYLVEGEGKVLVNGLELNEYFQRSVDRDQVNLPLEVTDNKDKFNAWIVVKGGGSTGQAQAIKLGLGKALLIHNSELKPVLRKAGCITRDPRVVERKKEGQRKARAKYTWVKR
ncbi:ribosomal protein S9/S16-domain-containing protein [Gilbertella persicaria]|uniref:Small ribosomal subunit protein uS9m n=1 Tax=Rhizopus stolonifer TaxID=4846 RepID=A0A367KX33_RHIST|nr:ribosomal protein S9/S16-domain-containing protein [Gilbertella persicaria]KAI8085805.1 ribosomal protein S9/S16-domain-containing protein [Gilbertella persicaria]RCI06778.1 37S ribosomal protein S9, mitochondrial [Rhizopus stolonifer]